MFASFSRTAAAPTAAQEILDMAQAATDQAIQDRMAEEVRYAEEAALWPTYSYAMSDGGYDKWLERQFLANGEMGCPYGGCPCCQPNG